MIARWQPGEVAATIARLERAFGQAEIHAMLRRLQVVLTEAIGRFDDDSARTCAHRIAGIAGTLGFTALGQAWSAYSEHGADDPGPLRRRTAAAIAEIDRIVGGDARTP